MKTNLKARATEGALGFTSEGAPQVAVSFQITEEGPRMGESLTWYGYFSEKTQARTIESLRHCGWQGDDLSDLRGIDTNEVQLVVEPDTFNGVTREKVQWVNKLGGGVHLKARMSEGDAKAFAARMMGAVIAAKQGAPAAPTTAAKPPSPGPAKAAPPPPPAFESTGTDDIPF